MFQNSIRSLLQNNDQIWVISAPGIKLSVHSPFSNSMSFHIGVDLRKELILPGAHLYDLVASNFNVQSATETTIHALSDLNFVVDSTLRLVLPNTALDIYVNGTYIGYAPV